MFNFALLVSTATAVASDAPSDTTRIVGVIVIGAILLFMLGGSDSPKKGDAPKRSFDEPAFRPSPKRDDDSPFKPSPKADSEPAPFPSRPSGDSPFPSRPSGDAHSFPPRTPSERPSFGKPDFPPRPSGMPPRPSFRRDED